ncbi:MAG: AmmeMemoRadiSam system protein B [Kiritimatiellae bacterium]|nr:AmmeMemoRadiSam system protein B [Kiritimatiellia bacterium]
MILESTIAGAWYPETERGICEMVEKWECSAAASSAERARVPNILILPHAGWAYSGETAWSAVRGVKGASFHRVVILAPSHRAWIENRLVAPKAEATRTPLGEIRIDHDWLDSLALVAPIARNDRVHHAEHSAQIEYPLLQLALGSDFKIAPLIVGSLGPDQMGMCARAIDSLIDPETLVVVSSDFTHYGSDFSYTPFGTRVGEDIRRRVAVLDAEAFRLIEKGDADGFAAFIKRTGATICGHTPIEIILRAFQGRLSLVREKYATSSDDTGDYSRFVCYLAASGNVAPRGENESLLSADEREFLLRLARESITRAVRGETAGATLRNLVACAPKPTRAKMGAFVTLNDKTTGALRGCIGEILPMRPLVEAVAQRAVDSALHDPRFLPVTECELANLRVEVSALTAPKPVASWRDIVLGRDGMTLEKSGCFAVFLPQVAPEQGWDLQTTLSYLSQKAGLDADAWREGAKFETFQAEVFHE